MQDAQNVIYKYGFAAQEWLRYPGGLYKASSTANFPASENLSGALVKLNPGGMREMHWHNPNEWGFVVNGTCRATLVNPGSGHMVESCKSVLARLFGYTRILQLSGSKVKLQQQHYEEVHCTMSYQQCFLPVTQHTGFDYHQIADRDLKLYPKSLHPVLQQLSVRMLTCSSADKHVMD